MSRHGYIIDDDSNEWLWRQAVNKAIRGKRGQKLLLDLRYALDAMPEKFLASESLVNTEGERCVLGVLAATRGIDVTQIDPEEPEQVASAFGIAQAMAREIMYENDEGAYTNDGWKRWRYMRRWVDRHILQETAKDSA